MFDWDALPEAPVRAAEPPRDTHGEATAAQGGEADEARPEAAVAAATAEDPAEATEPSAAGAAEGQAGGAAGAVGASPADPRAWRVVHSSQVNVREGRTVHSKVLGSKPPGAELRGEEEGGWLRLLDEPGFMRVSADFCPFLLPAAQCVGDFQWVGTESIFKQLEQELAEARAAGPGAAPAPRSGAPPRLQLPPRALGTGAAAAETAAAAARGHEEEEPHFTVNLAEGTQLGAEEAATEAVAAWLARARLWMQRLDPKALVPPSARLPRSAVSWEPAAAVLFVLTHGHFSPQRDVPALGEAARVREGLVSVCCATSDRRRTFHPLLYENFRKQTHEPRELVVVHTGELPSEFFLEKARSDSRVVYRFFPVTHEAPGSPRLTDERMGNPWDAVLMDDDPAELSYWEHGDPWTWEIRREGWTKGLKRNVACCIARGSVIVHFDDGCLYAPSYLGRMLGELRNTAPQGGPLGPRGGTLSKWYTVAISGLEFRLVDMRRPEPMWELYGQDARGAQERDQLNHGFNYIYTRAAWEQQPFPDLETVGTKDSDFMKALRAQGVPVKLLDSGTQEAIAACGWHRDATCGSKEVPANVNDAQVLDFLRFRGEDASTPQAFGDLLRLTREAASDLLDRRERYLQDLVREHGSVYVCSYCNFAVALTRNVRDRGRAVSTSMQAVDGFEMTKTFAKHPMKFEVCEVAKAGGAVAEGHWGATPSGHGWLAGVNQRNAICRNCGFQLGWRYEPQGLPRECASPCCTYQAAATRDYCCSSCRGQGPHHHDADCEKKDAPAPQAPVFWGVIWRHLRERQRPGEHVPQEDDRTRHKETGRNYRKNDVCPEGHKLRCFCTGQGNGGALPFYYICDLCNRPAQGAEHLWGCGSCDYDMCERCRARRV